MLEDYVGSRQQELRMAQSRKRAFETALGAARAGESSGKVDPAKVKVCNKAALRYGSGSRRVTYV